MLCFPLPVPPAGRIRGVGTVSVSALPPLMRLCFFRQTIKFYYICYLGVVVFYLPCGGLYEISLRVLKNISRVSTANELNIFQHEKRNFVSPSGHVTFYLFIYLFIYYINTSEIPNHFTFRCERHDLLCYHSKGDLFTCEDNMLFSHVELTCYFHVWRYHIFARKLIWYFTGVYIIKLVILQYYKAFFK